MKKVLILLMSLLMLVSVAYSQVEKGDSEVQLKGSIVAMESITMMFVQGTYGYFYSPNFEVGLGPTITYFDFWGFDETTLGSSIFARYNFVKNTKQVPYLSGQLYQSDFSPAIGTSFTDYTFIQVGGGIKFFVNEYVCYDVSANYGFGLGDIGGALLISGGLSAFF